MNLTDCKNLAMEVENIHYKGSVLDPHIWCRGRATLENRDPNDEVCLVAKLVEVVGILIKILPKHDRGQYGPEDVCGWASPWEPDPNGEICRTTKQLASACKICVFRDGE